MTGIVLSGAWTTPTAVLTVVIAGLDCGDFQIGTDGTVTIPWGSDPGGLLQPGYLNSVSDPNAFNPGLSKIQISDGTNTTIVYVPVEIGYNYVSGGAPVRPMNETQIKSSQGGGLGKTRRSHWASVLFQSAQGVYIGGSTLNAITFTDGGGNPLLNNQLYSGVWQQSIEDNYGFDGIVTWAVPRPYPCTVVSLNTFLETQER